MQNEVSQFMASFINLDGNISPCGRLQHIILIIEQGFDKAWNGPKMKMERRTLSRAHGTYCQRECHMKNTCPSRLGNLKEFMGPYDEG